MRAGRVDGWTAAALLVDTTAYLYVVFKAGLLIATTCMRSSAGRDLPSRRRPTCCCAGSWATQGFLIALQAVALALVVLLVPRSYKPGTGMDPGVLVLHSPAAVPLGRCDCARPGGPERTSAPAPGGARSCHAGHCTSLPRLEGAVDIIPSKQSLLIAHGLDYRPRFTVQEYTTYTDVLIERNRAFFRGALAPANLIPAGLDRPALPGAGRGTAVAGFPAPVRSQ